MDKLINSIEEKLLSFSMNSFAHYDKKTQERLVEIEQAWNDIHDKNEQLYLQLKGSLLNRSKLLEHESISFSRKTSYNDSIINVYIDNLISLIPDYFNEDNLESLKKQVVDLQMMYNNVLRQNISTILLQQEIEEFKKLVKTKDNRIYALHEIINEKDKIIMNMSNQNIVQMKRNENT